MFCKNCGNELSDNAYVCTKCGCLVNEENSETQSTTITESGNKNNDKKSLLVRIFLIITIGFIFAALTCDLLAVAAMDIYVTDYYIDLYINSTWAAMAFIDGLLALGFGIATFVLGVKNTDKILKMMSIICFVVSIIMQVTTFLMIGFI